MSSTLKKLLIGDMMLEDEKEQDSQPGRKGGPKRRRPPVRGPFHGGLRIPRRARVPDLIPINPYLKREVHYLTSTASGSFASTGTLFGPFTTMNQGDDIDERQGLNVRGLRVDLNWKIEYNAAGSTNQYVRLIYFLDRVIEGVTGTTDILTASDILATYNRKQHYRYKILLDKFYRMDASKTSTSIIQHRIPFKYIVRFDGTTDADVRGNHLYVIALCHGAANQPTYEYRHEFTYTEL